MSNSQFAFIQRQSVPDRATLQASLDRLGFDLQLNPDFTPFDDSGFLPFTLNGSEGPGFEIHYSEAQDVVGDDEGFAAIAGGRDYCITMTWGGRMKDLACVMMVSCALAQDFGAVVSYEGEEPQPLDEMLHTVQVALKEAAKEK
jgi:hypothetical protein